MNAVKKIFKLIRLGVFCRWFRNVKRQRGLSGRGIFFVFKFYLSFLIDNTSLLIFMASSFPWDRTIEGQIFWQNISEK